MRVVNLHRRNRESKSQMVGDPTPGFWFFCGISVDQQPGAKVNAKDNYVYPPQEQPAKTPWMWQKSMIQQATNKNTEDKSEKNEWQNKIDKSPEMILYFSEWLSQLLI